ncbi:hypothetical protein [Mucilaginibacter sp. KACC 22063]|uniref:hypothetical protein n=1 Tax=Mucilaginibacter sp. KACC 22063 TaxID=3025666 RepID=UPI00236555B0|nr:hypothetical protein [Mucilaginibacter sp. KACC 22063]WDF57181.1 hypothetical protein PQ461_08955 [Mucilaginibacter sp. KACC 22063]
MRSTVTWTNWLGFGLLVLFYLLVCSYENECPEKKFSKRLDDSTFLGFISKFFPTDTAVIKLASDSLVKGHWMTVYKTNGEISTATADTLRSADQELIRIFWPPISISGKEVHSLSEQEDSRGGYQEPARGFFYSHVFLNGDKLAGEPQNEVVLFDKAHFNRSFTLDLKHSGQPALSFYGTYFNDDCNVLVRDSLKGGLIFNSCALRHGIYLKATEAGNRQPADFMKKAGYMQYQQFKGSLTLRNCILDSTLDLSGATFLPNAELRVYNTNLPQEIDLSNVTADRLDISNFENKDGRVCDLILDGSMIKDLNFEYDHFRLVSKSTNKEEVLSVYQKTLNYLKNNGYTSSFKKLDIEYRRKQVELDTLRGTRAGTFSSWIYDRYRFDVFVDRLSDLWWKYGYEKWRILPWSVLLILLFTGYNLQIFERLQELYYVEKLDPKNIKYHHRAFARQFTYW